MQLFYDFIIFCIVYLLLYTLQKNPVVFIGKTCQLGRQFKPVVLQDVDAYIFILMHIYTDKYTYNHV